MARADLSLVAHPNPHVRGEVRLDFARLLSSEEVSDTVREFYAEWTPAPPIALVAGVFAADALRLDLAALDGGATGAQDYRGPGLLSARLSGEPLEHLKLEVGASVRPRPIDAWWEELRYRYQA
jgi:hypothetical protein